MPLEIVRNDITKMKVDAIVNASNKYLLSGSGVNGAIHKAAGPKLLAECLLLGGCKTGEAKITGGYNLPSTYVIHTVGPVWNGGGLGEAKLLAACYQNALKLACKHQCTSVAFPLISSGVFGYPMEQAFKIAVETISDFLLSSDTENDLKVYLVVYNKTSVQISQKLFAGIEQYIDDHYVEEHTDFQRENARMLQIPEPPCYSSRKLSAEAETVSFLQTTCAPKLHTPASSPAPTLESALKLLDESFSQMVLRKIQEKGLKNSDCYKKANLDKKLFSKIYNDVHYKPKKTTALALAIALELSLEETKELLMKAGLALSHSDKFDIIVEYFITQGNYNIFEINEVLFYYDQSLLGSVAY